MNTTCGYDIIDISKVNYVDVSEISEYELGELEEKYNGDYPGSLNDLLRGSHRRSRYLYDPYVSIIEEALPHKIEEALNKYWYEVGLLLPHPESERNARDKWEYAVTKQSSFIVSRLDSIGDATVIWSFAADYGTNSAGYRYSRKK